MLAFVAPETYFADKNYDTFLISALNIAFTFFFIASRCLLEPPHGVPMEYPQSMF